MSRLIDADALTEKYGDWYTEEGTEEGYIGTIKGIVDSMPTIEERKKGEWIEENTRPRSSQFYCSVCHRTAYDPQPTRIKGWTKRCRYAFCPNCGADMRERREE